MHGKLTTIRLIKFIFHSITGITLNYESRSGYGTNKCVKTIIK